MLVGIVFVAVVHVVVVDVVSEEVNSGTRKWKRKRLKEGTMRSRLMVLVE